MKIRNLGIINVNSFVNIVNKFSIFLKKMLNKIWRYLSEGVSIMFESMIEFDKENDGLLLVEL